MSERVAHSTGGLVLTVTTSGCFRAWEVQADGSLIEQHHVVASAMVEAESTEAS